MSEERMDKERAIKLIVGAREYVYSIYQSAYNRPVPFSIVFDSSMCVDEGVTRDEYGRISYMHVGTHEVEFDENPLMKDVVKCVVGVFHEGLGHGCQIGIYYKQTTEEARVLCMNHFACKASMNYQYGYCNESYYKQPKEYVAQYAGIMFGYKYLSKEFSEEYADAKICDYVNERIFFNSEFITFDGCKEYTSVSEILNKFRSDFSECVYANRTFSNEVPVIGYYDALQYYSHEKGFTDSQVDVLMHSRHGVKRDMMLASIYLYQEDKNDQLRNIYPVLQDVPTPEESMKRNVFLDWMRFKHRDLVLDSVLPDIIQEDKDFEKD